MRVLASVFLFSVFGLFGVPSGAESQEQELACHGCWVVGADVICVANGPSGKREWCLMFMQGGTWHCNQSMDYCPDLVYDDLAADISVTSAGTLDGIAGFEQMDGNVVRLCNGAVVNSLDESPLPKEIVFTTR